MTKKQVSDAAILRALAEYDTLQDMIAYALPIGRVQLSRRIKANPELMAARKKQKARYAKARRSAASGKRTIKARIPPEKYEIYRLATKKADLSFSEFIIRACDRYARELTNYRQKE